jgi:glycosyltransferase involved in cell wall biosynthesis
MQRLASDDALRQKLAANAVQLGEAFDWATIATQTATLFQEIVG